MGNNKPNIPHKRKLDEAIYRMKLLGFSEAQIEAFQDRNMIPLFLTGNEAITFFHEPPAGSYIRMLEEKHNMLVYCIITTGTSMGTMESLLFVSDYEEEWEDEHVDLEDGYALTWTENLTYPACSEFGSIGFTKSATGALWRIS